MNNIKSIVVGLLLAIFILLAAVISISIIYEDEVSQYLVGELNEYILSEIEVDDINFSLLKKFPKASIEFKDVIAFSKAGYLKKINGFDTDTLFYAKSIFIQLNIKDIINKNYNISRIHFDKGKINLFIDRFGDPNYIFWDNKSSKEEKEDFKFELKEVKITESEVFYYNEATALLTEAKINRIDFEGNFSKQNYLMKVRSNMLVRNLAVNKISYIDNKNFKTNFNLDIINDIIQFNNGVLTLENLKFGLNGKFEKSGKRGIDLLISGKNLGLKSFLENLPTSIKREFPAISGQKGNITMSLNISGENLRVSRPHINTIFFINDAQLFHEDKELQFSNIQIEGEFNNGDNNNSKTSTIDFKTFKFDILNNIFKGGFTLQNFKDPVIKLDMETELYFNEIKDIFHIDTLEVFNGHAIAQVKYNGKYEELKAFKFPHLFTRDYSITLNLEKGELKIKDKPLLVSDISGDFDLNRSLYAENLGFKIGNNDFLITGRISKLFEYLNDREIFNVNAKLYSRKTNLNELAHLFRVDKTEGKNSSYKFPDKLALQLRLDIQNFEVGKFNATNIKGNLNYKPRMFSLHEVSFNSMNGSVKAGGVIIQKFNNDFLVKTQSKLKNINMSNLFYSFNNFGQNFITNDNLNGNLDGDIYFTSEWSDNIKVYKETVTSDCDIVISDGELNDFEPMLGLSGFIDVDELKKIKFSTLKNKISIENEKIIIPQMYIESSVLNLTASGEHYFNNNYSYHTELLLSELLSRKVKKSKQKKNKFENIEEDQEGRITLYLLIEGDKNKNNVKYDRKAARVDRKERMRAEKNELKKILNEEFGWYGKDSSINKSKGKSESFKIEFEEKKKKKDSAKTVSDQKFIIEWEEDTSVNNYHQ